MRCKNYSKCGNRTDNPKKICWRKFHLCGECAVIQHPEAYDHVYVKKIISKMKRKGRYNDQIGRVL
jgi:hypothetical protein